VESLKPDVCYHNYNHANGFENVFQENENFRYFLEKYWVYITPIAETYAYCLMPNHFHLVIRIRKREVIEKIIQNKNNSHSPNNLSDVSLNFSNVSLNFSKVSFDFGKVCSEVNVSNEAILSNNVISNDDIEKFLSKQFANLFSCYTQSFNKLYHRMGSLFIKNFKREPIVDKNHFHTVVMYTHRNPIHHGFTKSYNEYSYTSYNEIMDSKSETIEITKLMKIFGGRENLIEKHRIYLEEFNNKLITT